MDEELVFYYERKKRLERAGKNVRMYYDGTAVLPPKGLFKALVHTKHSRFMLLALVISLFAVIFVALFAGRDDVRSLGGLRFQLSAFSFEDSVYISLKTSVITEFEDGELLAAVVFSALDKEKKTLISKKNELMNDGNENYCRTIFTDYDIVYVQADVEAKGEKLRLCTRVMQR